VVRAQNIFEQVLAPLQGVNLAELYMEYSGIFDFALFLILFLGISRVVYSRMFSGQGAKAITIGVALVLALALAVAESMIGFSVISIFGPLACAIFVGIVGVALYQLLTAAGANKQIAASATYVVIYLSFTGVAPEYFDWLNSKTPILGGLLAVGLLAGLILLVHGIVKQVRNRIQTPKLASPVEDFRTEHQRKNLKEEHKQEKHVVKEEKVAEKDAKSIIHDLKVIKGDLSNKNKHGEITSTLSRIYFNDKELHRLLDEVGRENLRLENFDSQEYAELKQRYSGAKLEEQQELFRAEINTELKRLKVNRRLREAENQVQQELANFDDLLRLAVTHLKSGEPDHAKTVVGKAIDSMKKVEDQLEELRRLNHVLKGLGSKLRRQAIKQENTYAHQKAA